MMLSVTSTKPLPPTTLAEIVIFVPNVPLLLAKNLNRPVVESPTEYSILSTVGVEGGPACGVQCMRQVHVTSLAMSCRVQGQGESVTSLAVSCGVVQGECDYSLATKTI